MVDASTTALQHDEVSGLRALSDDELDAVAGGRAHLVFFDWDKVTQAGGPSVTRNIGLDPDAVTRR